MVAQQNLPADRIAGQVSLVYGIADIIVFIRHAV